MIDSEFFLTAEDLRDFLEANGISTVTWGTGVHKSLNDLLYEYKLGESKLFIGDDGIPRREIVNVAVDVLCTAPDGTRQRLVETKQILDGDRERRRSGRFGAVGEKRLPHESLEQTVARGIHEELRGAKAIAVKFVDHELEERESGSYPGLLTIYDTYKYVAELRPDDYRPEGFVEAVGTQETHFGWTLA